MSNVPVGIGPTWVDKNLYRLSQLGNFANMGWKLFRPIGYNTDGTSDAEASFHIGADTVTTGTGGAGGFGIAGGLDTTINGSAWTYTSQTKVAGPVPITSWYGSAAANNNLNANFLRLFSYPASTAKWGFFCRFNAVTEISGTFSNTSYTKQWYQGARTNGVDTAGWSLGIDTSISNSDSGATCFYVGRVKNTGGTSTALSTIAASFNTWHSGYMVSDGVKIWFSIDNEQPISITAYRTPDSAILLPFLYAQGSGAKHIVSALGYVWDN